MGKVEKTFVIMLSVNLFLYFFFPFVASTQNTLQDSIISKFIDLDSNTPTIDGTEISGEMSEIEIETDDAVVGSGTLSIVSTIRTIWGYISAIIGILFAPVMVIASIPNVPNIAILLFALPNTLILVFGTISFIKGNDW